MKFGDLKPGTVFRWKNGSYNMLKLAPKNEYVLLDRGFQCIAHGEPETEVIVLPSFNLESPEYIRVPREELEALKNKVARLEALKQKADELWGPKE